MDNFYGNEVTINESGFSFEFPEDEMQTQIFDSLKNEDEDFESFEEDDNLLEKIDRIKHEVYLLQNIAIKLNSKKENCWIEAIKKFETLNRFSFEMFLLDHPKYVDYIDLTNAIGDDEKYILESHRIRYDMIRPRQFDFIKWLRISINIDNITVVPNIEKPTDMVKLKGMYKKWLIEKRHSFCFEYSSQIQKKYDRCVRVLSVKRQLLNTLIRKMYHTTYVDTSQIKYNNFNLYPDAISFHEIRSGIKGIKIC